MRLVKPIFDFPGGRRFEFREPGGNMLAVVERPCLMTSRLEKYLPDEAATARLGAALAGLLRAGDVIALKGDLGAGKTTLARGLIRALCGKDTEVPSPTYTLVQAYDARRFHALAFRSLPV